MSWFHLIVILLANDAAIILMEHLDHLEKSYDENLASSYNYFGEIHIKLHLFYDQSLLERFGSDHDRVHKFIFTLVNSVSLSYNNQPLNRLAKFYFLVLDIQQIDNNLVKINPYADGEVYRKSFRKQYFQNLSRPFSVAVLLTGYNFRYKRNRTDSQGLATQGFVACNRAEDSFIIIEARSYRAAFILAHEIGHTLNMHHDEPPFHNEDYYYHDPHRKFCNSNYIMSSTTGPGKTKFSPCSYYYLKRFFLNMNHQTKKCFQHKPKKYLALFPCEANSQYKACQYPPITITEHCQIALGKTFHWIMDDDQHHNQQRHLLSTTSVSVCSKIQCTNQIMNIFIDPAIENSTCAPGRFCRGGKCL